MTKTLKLAAAALLSASAIVVAMPSYAMDEITVAYFPEWPMPFQYAQANDLYADADLKINWVSFDAGTAMSAAMASGDVQIAVSMGVTPFVLATSKGQDLQAVDIAVSYSDNNNCVVRSDLEITKDNAKELEGKQVAIPLGTAADTDFRMQMAHFGVDTSTMTIVDMAPVDAAAAFATGNLDMVCGWGGPLRRMKEHGNVLLSGAEKQEVSGKIYDVTTVVGSWAKENADVVSRFLKVTHDMNTRFNGGDKEAMYGDIAKQAGMDEAATIETMGIMEYVPLDAQLSGGWLGGFVAGDIKRSADNTAKGGEIQALPSYEGVINTSYLEAAMKM